MSITASQLDKLVSTCYFTCPFVSPFARIGAVDRSGAGFANGFSFISTCPAATCSLRSFPPTLPTGKRLPFSHSTGPFIHLCCSPGPNSPIAAWSWGSSCGSIPKSQSRSPPYFFGMPLGSMKDVRVGLTSAAERMKILETVTGSNHLLIHDQTVGKNAGAPIIC